MRLVAVPIAFFAAMLLSIVPVSAQTVSPVAVTITNTLGPIPSCPVTVNFSAAITVSNFAQGANREIQYKWLNSTSQDAPTQTLPVPPPSGRTANGIAVASLPGAPATVTAAGSWTVGAGTYWEELQINFPVNQTSPHLNFVVTCPTPGSLTIPTVISPIKINPIKP